MKGRIVLVANRCVRNATLRSNAEVLRDAFELCFSDTGIEYAGCLDEDGRTVFVYDDFTDDIFHRLATKNCCIVGPDIVHEAAQKKLPSLLTDHSRPLYNRAMEDVVVCFTGFKDREQISRLASLVHYMSGTIRKEFTPKVTHLVAYHCKGSKYKSAMNLGRPIMQHDWIHQLWEKRDTPEIKANSPEMMQYRAPPFLRCAIAFHGFSETDFKEMEEIAMTNGGQLSSVGDPDCTHVVLDSIQSLPTDVLPNVFLVRAEWFWASVQIEACADEEMYAARAEGTENTPSSRLTPGGSRRYTPSRSKKRKRAMRHNLASLANEGEMILKGKLNKSRRSSADQLNISEDMTPDSSGCLLDTPSPNKKVCSPEKPSGKASARYNVVAELLQTEINYCGILRNVLDIFRDGAEKPDQPGGAILSQTDSKIIFGKIPPILEVHTEIKAELEYLLRNWCEDTLIAHIILKKVDKLRQAYPPFVNYFEKTKEKISECIRTNHRFHAFMKVCERKPECGRQALPDLMMNIIQRLPRIELLLQQIHKYTDKRLSDHSQLESVQNLLKDVMTHINEDKRITDERMVLFDIMNDIENCPPYLLSASRNIIYKLDVDEVSDIVIGRGGHLTLFLFSDSLEIVKRRNKNTATPFKSPAPVKSSSQAKPFKHLEFLTLPSIKRVIDVSLDEDGFGDSSSLLFSLVSRQVTDSKERLYTFQLPDDSVDKSELLKTLAKNIANCCCRTDYETLLTTVPASQFMITPLDTGSSNRTMTRAVSKFGKRLSRAMTMKNVSSPIKRAVSTIMTPTRRGSMRRADNMAAGSLWDLNDSSPKLASSLVSPVAQSYATLPRNYNSNANSKQPFYQ